MGGQLQMCEVGKMSQHKINANNKHYMLLGLAILIGDPVIPIIIFAGVKPKVLCEVGWI